MYCTTTSRAFDGMGYLHNLKAEQINLYTRCVATADIFDADFDEFPAVMAQYPDETPYIFK